MNLDRLCDLGLRLGLVAALAALVGCAHAPAGTYATIVLREFMKNAATQSCHESTDLE